MPIRPGVGPLCAFLLAAREACSFNLLDREPIDCFFNSFPSESDTALTKANVWNAPFCEPTIDGAQ
jgi:hypothetical protein